MNLRKLLNAKVLECANDLETGSLRVVDVKLNALIDWLEYKSDLHHKIKRVMDRVTDERLGFMVRCWMLEDLAEEAMKEIEDKEGKTF